MTSQPAHELLRDVVEPLLRFHETGGHEGDGSDERLTLIREALSRLQPQLAECCERPRLRTIYRGRLGCLEECESCGFTYAYGTDGEPTETTRAALRAHAGGQHGNK